MKLKEYNEAYVKMATKVNYSEASKAIDTLKMLLIFIDEAKSILFKDGKIITLSIYNIISLYRLAKLSYHFIKQVIEQWK